ncbi:LuxR family transcriptional regulator [Streptacidiphilus pinicola]|uniref:LuxR family transcriptional regulator n=1 Tax=Streptacidiphilus pinicola TaxID=2219663 RepID=A0A2X0IEE8_9ACTN|nr:LuxR C-terminal-related transcriptional regulator [Streptacidiphilus pinicola]RAG83364.1 LuxR family transcriptional regulator [Streptacidiphilus pinicola]
MSSDEAVRARIRDRIMRLCGAGLGLRALQDQAAAALRQAVPCDAWCIGTLDPATLMITSSVGEGYPMKGSGRFLEIEYGEPDVNKFAELARRRPPVGRLVDATGGAPESSPHWREICRPSGLRDELRAALVVDETCWGSLNLGRSAARGDFTARDARYLAGLIEPLALALRAALVSDSVEVHDTTIGPGLLIVGDDLQPTAVSPAGQQLLGELRGLEADWMGPLPNAVYSVISCLKELERENTTPADLVPRVRVRAGNGRWLSVQASRLVTGSGERQVAVILEPAGPGELAPLIVRAYALTGRESEVASRVLQGLSTREIAASLFISPATVQQHLKTVFEKVGVRSRRELVGRVFQQQYRPRLATGRPVGPDGWFTDASR